MDYYEEVILFLTSMSVAALAAEYKKAEDAYRNGTPLMTDLQFDQLEDKLRKAAPHHPHLQGDSVVMLGLRPRLVLVVDISGFQHRPCTNLLVTM